MGKIVKKTIGWIEALCTSLEKHEEHQLRSDKLYLYYTQKGRCMYSGEPIDLEDLWDNTKYDIDHIYPQSKTMDDSLKNRVLVKKEYNAKKSDTYPIAADIQKKMMPFWKSLLTGGFIPKEKYDRLVRNNPLDANELAGFIERQIVETRQSTKAVAEILKKILPDTEIVYVKAKTVSKFRQDFDFIKVRDMNDLHHAKDASDLMEPFRPLVDKCVLGMKLEQFEHEEKMWLVDILNQEVQIDGKIQYVSNAIKIYCKSVFDALNEDDSALVRFYKIEL